MDQRIALALSALLLLSACSKPDADGDAVAGRVLAERNCQTCHAIGPTGASPVAQAPPFRDIAKKWPPESLAESMAEGMQVGHSGQVDMPEFAFETTDINNLIAYLKTLENVP